MTRVNWELEPGERVQEFVAALLLLEFPSGNLITPSQGDRGVDIRVWTPDGFDIYQVKRHCRPLTAGQAKKIEQSWATFRSETLGSLPVRSWNLVMPWEPTNERLDWLAAMVSETDLKSEWLGRVRLDGLASNHPKLVDYFFGDGGERLHKLMADALNAAKELPSSFVGEALLDAVLARQAYLASCPFTGEVRLDGGGCG